MEALAERTNVAGVRLVAPAAPGGSWYPQRFIVPRADNEPHLSRALATVDDALDRLEGDGVAPERTVLGGFSQGAVMTHANVLNLLANKFPCLRARRIHFAFVLTCSFERLFFRHLTSSLLC